MLTPAKTIEGRDIQARDGAIGSVRDIYFDDQHWIVRYLVVRAGSWLTSRDVLISPSAFEPAGAGGSELATTLTREQVKNSPHVETDRPVSRQKEIELTDYYGWPYYWTAPALGTGYVSPIDPAAAPRAAAMRDMAGSGPMGSASDRTIEKEVDVIEENTRSDPHLRSTRAVRGYSIEAIDGSVGHVEDFLLDDRGWSVRYLIADTKNWLPGKKVILPLNTLRAIEWESGTVRVDLTRDLIKSSPQYDAEGRNASDYTDQLEKHFADYRRDAAAARQRRSSSGQVG